MQISFCQKSSRTQPKKTIFIAWCWLPKCSDSPCPIIKENTQTTSKKRLSQHRKANRRTRNLRRVRSITLCFPQISTSSFGGGSGCSGVTTTNTELAAVLRVTLFCIHLDCAFSKFWRRLFTCHWNVTIIISIPLDHKGWITNAFPTRPTVYHKTRRCASVLRVDVRSCHLNGVAMD